VAIKPFYAQQNNLKKHFEKPAINIEPNHCPKAKLALKVPLYLQHYFTNQSIF